MFYCSYVTSAVECLHAQQDCETLTLLLAPAFANLRQAAAMFDCRITLGNHTFEPNTSGMWLTCKIPCLLSVWFQFVLSIFGNKMATYLQLQTQTHRQHRAMFSAYSFLILTCFQQISKFSLCFCLFSKKFCPVCTAKFSAISLFSMWSYIVITSIYHCHI